MTRDGDRDSHVREWERLVRSRSGEAGGTE